MRTILSYNGSSAIEADDEDPAAQLREELKQSVSRALSTRRPILTHLNADTTWLLSVPYPASSPPPSSHTNRTYFHIITDPWLRGSQSDVAAFFSTQWHAETSCVQTISEVEDIIAGIEDAASVEETFTTQADEKLISNGDENRIKSRIDAIIISHEFTDHMHAPTLLEIAPTVPVYATAKAASIIRYWSHFTQVHNIPNFKSQATGIEGQQLPNWLGITRVAYEGTDLLYYHSAVLISFSSPISSNTDKHRQQKQDTAEVQALLYTPHGISPRDITPLLSPDTETKIKILALLHGLQDISLPAGAQLNLGAHNGLKVLRLLRARYWIGTHDEVKRGGGVVSWFLRRRVVSVGEAVERERGDGGGLEGLGDVRFEEVGNGVSIVLE